MPLNLEKSTIANNTDDFEQLGGGPKPVTAPARGEYVRP